ncbi:MAG: hypothetical protein M1376_24635, partial [Planctomycetes bacterium]|nr:hypothetical protein [Planctomycetota bacterium]
MTGWHFRRESYQPRSVIFWAVLALCGGPLFALDTPGAPADAARHEVIPLTNIAPERAKEFLTRLGLGTASKLAGTNALLVTAEPGDLQKAIVLINLVDTHTEYGIQELGPAFGKTLPSSVQIASVMNGLSIGTFANPPRDKTKTQAIVDIHNGKIVAVAPVFQLPDLKRAVESGPETLAQHWAPAQPASVATTGPAPQAGGLPDLSREIPHLKSVGSGELQASDPISSFAPTDNRRSDEYARQRELQRLLREMRGHATASAAQPKLLAPADAKPVPVALAKPQPLSSLLAAAQPVAPKRENRAAGAQPQPTAEDRPKGASAAPSGVPATAPSQSSQPAQAAPQPQTTPVAASTTPQAQIPASLPAESAEAETK